MAMCRFICELDRARDFLTVKEAMHISELGLKFLRGCPSAPLSSKSSLLACMFVKVSVKKGCIFGFFFSLPP